MTNKVDTLRHSDFTVEWIDPNDISTIRDRGYVNPYQLDKIPHKGAIPFVDLGSVAAGEDTANQTSTVNRSNYRRLREDYPTVFINVSYYNVDTLGAIVPDLPDEVINLLIGLKEDYPLYDEEDLCNLEDEEITDSWDQWVRSDVSSIIIEKLSYAEDEDTLDTWYKMDKEHEAELFWRCVEDLDRYPEHSGIEVIWNDLDKIAERMIRYLSGEITPVPDDQAPLF